MSRTLLINEAEPEERRAALLEDGRLSLLWVERSDEVSLVGNVYKGRVTRVEPAIGAAFVDIGLDRAGFLHADDVLVAGERGPGARSQIDELFRAGDDVVVQVARDPLGHKGASLTTRISLPGRFVVVLPGMGRVAASRKIEDEDERTRLLDVLGSVDLPPDVGLVARTAAVSVAADELVAEAADLLELQARIRDAADTRDAPCVVHEEAGFARRAVRELLVRRPEGANGPVKIVCDTADAVDAVEDAVAAIGESADVSRHESVEPLFHTFDIETEIRRLASGRVPLSGGASLVIQQTEALWAIDVNSGKRRRGANLEETALETDLLAAEEVARQIRLRDLSGLIVVDFIDCREPENRRQVEDAARAALARDPAKLRVAGLSEFMLLEITRRRSRTGAGRAGSHRCPTCSGNGRVRSAAAAGLAALRDARAVVATGKASRIEIVCSPAIADDLDQREASLEALEQTHNVEIDVVEDPHLSDDRFGVNAV